MARRFLFALALSAALAPTREASAQSRKPGEPPPPAEQRPTFKTRKPGEPPPPPDPVAAGPTDDGVTVVDEGQSPITTTLALAPVELFSGMGRVMVEHGFDKQFSGAAFAQLGKISLPDPVVASTDTSAWLGGVGAQGRYYFLGGYLGGFWAGPGVAYNFLDSDQIVNLTIANAASGLSLSGLAGFKIVADLGLSLDVGLGPRVVLFRPTPSTPSISPTANKAGRVLFALEIHLGWSF